jgi:hypothetical protein
MVLMESMLKGIRGKNIICSLDKGEDTRIDIGINVCEGFDAKHSGCNDQIG